MMSCVVPVSPSLGKIRAMLLAWASACVSVMASIASVTLKPSSWAWRAVTSTPLLVATPTITTWVTPNALQMGFEIGVGEGARRALGHDMVLRLPVQLGDEIGPAGRKCLGGCAAAPSGPAPAGDVDEHDRQAMTAKRIGQRADVLHHVARSDARSGSETMPFCRSMTMSAVFGSRVVTVTVFSFW